MPEKPPKEFIRTDREAFAEVLKVLADNTVLGRFLLRSIETVLRILGNDTGLFDDPDQVLAAAADALDRRTAETARTGTREAAGSPTITPEDEANAEKAADDDLMEQFAKSLREAEEKNKAKSPRSPNELPDLGLIPAFIPGTPDFDDAFNKEQIAGLRKGSGEAAIMEERHMEAQVARAERLRTSTAYRTLMQLVNEDPDLSREYRLVVERHKEFRALEKKGEHHRDFTAMIAALALSDRGKRLLDLAIDRTEDRDSAAMKQEIREGDNYTPEVVIGAGVHGTIYNLVRQMYFPKSPSLTADKEGKIGGQFARYVRAIFHLNSRNRPELRDKSHLPGTEQSLNTFMEYGVIQPSDVGHQGYQFQSELATAARANLFLSGRAMLGMELMKVRRNPRQEQGGALIMEFYDPQENRVDETETDRVVFATGVGEEITGLNESDTDTKQILVEEEEKTRNKQDSQVNSFTQFCDRVSDPENPFPLRNIKRLIISGKGDGRNVVAGIALGYEGQIGKTPVQLDHIEEIILIGEDILTKEKFLECVRTRYHLLGLDFPREQYERYYSRIRPIPGVRSERLRRVNGKIKVEGEGIPDDVVGDHFVYAHGFKDVTDNLVQPVYSLELSDLQSIESAVANVFARTPGDTFYYKSGNYKSFEVLAVIREGENQILRYRTISRSGKMSVGLVNFDEAQESAFRNRFLNPASIGRLEVAPLIPIGTIVVPDAVTDAPIAKKFPGAEIYKAGPASGLPLTSEERAQTPVYESIPENSAAIFRYAPDTAALAKQLAEEDTKRIREEQGASAAGLTAPGFVTEIDRMLKKSTSERVVLPSLSETEIKSRSILLLIDTKKAAKIPYDTNTSDMLRFAIGERLFLYDFPKNIPQIILTFEPNAKNEKKNENTASFSAKVNLPTGRSAFYREAINRVLVDPLVQGIVLKNSEAVGMSRRIRIDIPLEAGRVDIGNIRMTIARAEK